MTDEAPNALVNCNLCGQEITNHCMLSTDFGLLSMLEGSLNELRKHFHDCHGLDNPDPNFTMCSVCGKVEQYNVKTDTWKCGHYKGETHEDLMKRTRK